MESVNESKKETASYSKVLSQIDYDAAEVRTSTEGLRLTVKKLCGRLRVPAADPAEAARIKKQYMDAGWEYVKYDKKAEMVEFEGTLVKRLKVSGTEYLSTKAINNGESQDGQYSSYRRLGFGKVDGEWQFYFLDYTVDHSSPYDDEGGTTNDLDHIKRDELLLIADTLPAFLEEYAAHLKDMRKVMSDNLSKIKAFADRFDSAPKTD